MTLQELRYIITVADCQNITRASELLFISQSALSKYIKNLEHQLNIKLFSYQDKKIVPTAAGTRYIDAARSMLDIYEQMMQDITAPDCFLKGSLHLGVSIYGGAYILPRVLPRFRELFPHVTVILHEEHSNILEKMLQYGELDLCILRQADSLPDIEFCPLLENKILFAVGHDHPMADCAVHIPDSQYPFIDIRHFSHDRFILFSPGQRTRQIADQVLKKAGITPERTLVSVNPDTVQRLCGVNLGVGFIPELYIDPSNEENPLFFTIEDPLCTYPLAAAYRKSGYISKYCKRFILLLQEQFFQRQV